MLLQGARKSLELGMQVPGFGVAVPGLRAGDLQAMVPSQTRDPTVDTRLEIGETAPTHDRNLVVRMLHQRRQFTPSSSRA